MDRNERNSLVEKAKNKADFLVKSFDNNKKGNKKRLFYKAFMQGAVNRIDNPNCDNIHHFILSAINKADELYKRIENTEMLYEDDDAYAFICAYVEGNTYINKLIQE